VRRLAPRALADVLPRAVKGAEPATLLARVQALWPEVAGAAMAAEAEPRSERDGTVSVTCSSAVWAQELELFGPELTGRLNERLAASGGGRVEALRFSARGGGSVS
jgi:predicted nucleic acid-binding Zn ribbon protein